MTKGTTLTDIKLLAKKYGVTASGTKTEIASRILKLRGHLSKQAKQGLSTNDRKTLSNVVNSQQKSKGWFGLF